MTRAIVCALAASIALCACGGPPAHSAAAGTPPPEQAAALRALLAQEDAQIATLRAVQRAGAAIVPATLVAHGTHATLALARAAGSAVTNVADTDNVAFRSGETAAIAASRDELSAGGYDRVLDAESSGQIAAYANALALRTQRALSERATSLHEREERLAFALDRTYAHEALVLRLKLAYLPLDARARAAVRAQLAAVEQREHAPVARLRRHDAGILAAYAAQLRAAQARDTAQRTALIDATVAANLVARKQIAAPQTGALAGLPQRIAAFARGYAFPSQAHDIAAAFPAAGSAIARQFAAPQRTDRASIAATGAALATLERQRAATQSALHH